MGRIVFADDIALYRQAACLFRDIGAPCSFLCLLQSVATPLAQNWSAKTKPIFSFGRRRRENLMSLSSAGQTHSERFTRSVRNQVDIFAALSMSGSGLATGFE